MPAERVYADPQVDADVGRVAIQRGPVVYCLEGCDHGGHARDLCLPKESELSSCFVPDLLGGVNVVRGEALEVARGEAGELSTKKRTFQAVPYFSWDNREPGQMVVWLPESPDLAEVAGEDGITLNGLRIRASHCWTNDTLAAAADGMLPQSSGDHSLPRLTWWDHCGTSEWVSYQFPKPRTISKVSVYWFDDTGRGRCRVPAEWRLSWLDDHDWVLVKLKPDSQYTTATDCFNVIEFDRPVTTTGLRLDVKLRADASGGVLEWQVE
jgi:hypothetical protein